jgi:hypothetical protein
VSDIDRIAEWLVGQARLRAATSPSYLSNLLRHYRGENAIEIFGGRVLKGEWGECLVIPCASSVCVSVPQQADAEQALLSELRLIFGIGYAHDQKLHEEGYITIPSLLHHPRWKEAASRLLERWERPLNPSRVFESLSYWFGASHPLSLTLLGLTPRERILFFDLETLGLGGAPIVLAALARPSAQGITVTQYLARSFEEELPLLEQIDRELGEASLVVSYNGKTFDWTILRERFAYYGLPFRHRPIHIDLLHHARRAFRDALPDLQLKTVEERLLGIHREEDVPSEAIPQFYSVYLATENPGPLVPIVRHNQQDIESLVLLLTELLRRQTQHVR